MKTKILILGVSGMLGHKLFLQLSKNSKFDVYGTVRGSNIDRWFFGEELSKKIRINVDGDNFDSIIRAMASFEPNIVINCIGLIKQTPLANDPLSAITVNAQLSHRISMICKTAKARLIHFSTDCVFSGKKTNYSEDDETDAQDLYGRTKLLGEVCYPHCLTIRTSIIGHEIKGYLSLIEWFLRQEGKTKGYSKAIFSGLTTLEMARVLEEYIIPNTTLHGLYHLAVNPISKYDLLKLVSRAYKKEIEIELFDKYSIDRSLNSQKFYKDTGYTPPTWDILIEQMHKDYLAGSYKTVC